MAPHGLYNLNLGQYSGRGTANEACDFRLMAETESVTLLFAIIRRGAEKLVGSSEKSLACLSLSAEARHNPRLALGPELGPD